MSGGIDQRAKGDPSAPMPRTWRWLLSGLLAVIVAGGGYLIAVRGEAALIDLYAASKLLLCL